MQATPLCKCLGRHLAVAEVYKSLALPHVGRLRPPITPFLSQSKLWKAPCTQFLVFAPATYINSLSNRQSNRIPEPSTPHRFNNMDQEHQ